MDEREVVRLFLNEGFQISKNALKLVPEDPNELISTLKKIKPRPFIVTQDHINKIIKKKVGAKPKIEIIKEFIPRKTPLKVGDYVKYFLFRYEMIQKLLSTNPILEKLISINKITPKTNKFSIIVVVREKKQNSVLVEDPTGETHLFFEDNLKEKINEIFLDDIVGFKCKKIGERYYVEKIVLPDISFKKEIKKTEKEIRLLILSKPSSLDDKKFYELTRLIKNTRDTLNLIVFGDWHDEERLKETLEKDLMIVTKEDNIRILQVDDVKILLLPKHFTRDNPLFLINILRQRATLPINQKNYIVDKNLILEEIPDILISNSGEDFYKNYKGTTIISSSTPEKTFLIDLKTREVITHSI